MSSHIAVEERSQAKTVNWMLEDFPADLKQRCKEQAVLQQQTLKAFVQTALREAVGMPLVLKVDEARQEFTPSLSAGKPAMKSRNKERRGSTKGTDKAS
jgi:hypothetical protein